MLSDLVSSFPFLSLPIPAVIEAINSQAEGSSGGLLVWYTADYLLQKHCEDPLHHCQICWTKVSCTEFSLFSIMTHASLVLS